MAYIHSSPTVSPGVFMLRSLFIVNGIVGNLSRVGEIGHHPIQQQLYTFVLKS